MNLLYLLPLLSITNSLESAKDWIDPHDMNKKVKHKYEKPVSSTPLSENSFLDPSLDIISSHLKRVVSVLMTSAHVDKRHPEKYHGHIRFSLDPDQFDFLTNVVKMDLNLDNLRKLDLILSEGFQRTFVDGYMDAIESFQIKLYHLIINKQNVWLLGAIFLLYVVYQLFKNNFSFTYISKYLVLILLIVDLGFRYNQLVEEAEAHNLKVVYSGECDTDNMNWGTWMKFMMSSKECGKKTVTPLDAFLYQIKNLIIIPLHAFGTGMGGFGKNMFDTLPFGLNLVMWPLMLIFLLVIFLFSITTFTGRSIEINILHMLKLKFGGGKENAITGKTLEGLVDKVLHRPMVQNVNISVSENNPESVDKSHITVKGQQNPVLDKKATAEEIEDILPSLQKKSTDEHPKPSNETRTDSSTPSKAVDSMPIPTSPNAFLDSLDAILSDDLASGDSSFLNNSVRKRRRETIGSVLGKSDFGST